MTPTTLLLRLAYLARSAPRVWGHALYVASNGERGRWYVHTPESGLAKALAYWSLMRGWAR